MTIDKNPSTFYFKLWRCTIQYERVCPGMTDMSFTMTTDSFKHWPHQYGISPYLGECPPSGSYTVYHQNQAIMISTSRKQPYPLGMRHIPIQNITSFGDCGLYIKTLKQAFQSNSMFDSINDCQTTLHFLFVMRKFYQTNDGCSNMQSVTLCDYWDVTSQCIIWVTQWRRQIENWEPFHYALYIFMERRENSF